MTFSDYLVNKIGKTSYVESLSAIAANNITLEEHHKVFYNEYNGLRFNEPWLNKEFEFIICSAIWYKDLILKRDDLLRHRGFSPYNVDRGIVFCGWRHPNCLYAMIAVTGLRSVPAEVGEYVQGFLTNKNRFVDRKEAAQIALECNQISEPKNILFSEDVY